MKFTVLLPIYQRQDLENKYESVIESIYSNSYLPDQVIILIDGLLNDGFYKKVFNSKVKFGLEIFEPKKRLGLSEILNQGILLSSNEWIVRADGDDINHKNRFEVLCRYMDKDYHLIGSHVIEFNESSGSKTIKKLPLERKAIKKYLKFRNPINHMSVAFKRSVVLKLGMYPHLYLKEDYGLWIKMIANNYKCINIPDALVTVTSDENLFKRRGGFNYIKSEFSLLKFKLDHKTGNIFELIPNFLIRVIFISAPNMIKGYIYKFYLRKKF